ncbi:outer membrane beta-barrel protein [Aquabacterium sp.]|uniref:outer membrane beta-barrel protein n=1 Tax=Aquabacterium sp. TaxID=1872578 RepID=UPI0025C2196A|nr:outer membrane beta-barrel protein [Aquabacterium sp.]
MRTPALHKSLSFKRLSLAAAVASSVLAGSVAQAAPFSAYAGATVGLSPTGQRCPDYFPRCERVAAGAKMFGGWNVTPNVAAEVNYFYFGRTTSEPLLDKRSTDISAKAISLGINWNIEMFEVATSNIRLGVARVQSKTDTTSAVGVLSHDSDYTTSPYIGLGLSFPFNRHLRMVTGYDFIPVSGAGNRNRHMLSGGFQGEF